MEFNTLIRAIRPGLSAHLLPPLLLGQGIAFYLQQTFALAISLQVLILGFALHAAIGLLLILGFPPTTAAPSKDWY